MCKAIEIQLRYCNSFDSLEIDGAGENAQCWIANKPIQYHFRFDANLTTLKEIEKSMTTRKCRRVIFQYASASSSTSASVATTAVAILLLMSSNNKLWANIAILHCRTPDMCSIHVIIWIFNPFSCKYKWARSQPISYFICKCHRPNYLCNLKIKSKFIYISIVAVKRHRNFKLTIQLFSFVRPETELISCPMPKFKWSSRAKGFVNRQTQTWTFDSEMCASVWEIFITESWSWSCMPCMPCMPWFYYFLRLPHITIYIFTMYIQTLQSPSIQTYILMYDSTCKRSVSLSPLSM